MTQTTYAAPLVTTAIQDVSPTSITGRMLSFAATSDGQTCFAGTYSNVWRSDDAGQTWHQLTRPQPPDGQFGVPGTLGGWGVIDMALFDGWHLVVHPRYLADLRGIGRADLVCFGDDGVYTALSNGDGTFQPPRFVLADFGKNQGWHGDRHVRLLEDVRGNGLADIVAFGDDGVYIAFGNGDGTFTRAAEPAIANLDYNHGWRVDKHTRVLADLNGNGRADIVAFGDDGVYVASNNGDGTFADIEPVLPQFGHSHGWSVDKHVRLLADITGNGRADIVAFGDDGVYVAINNGDGSFTYTAEPVVANFGYNDGWHVDKHPRVLADVTGNALPDIVAFGDTGVYVAINNGNGTFQPPKFVLGDFGYNQGWRVDKHVRVLADLTGNGRADIVAFGDEGVSTALSAEPGTFGAACIVLPIFGWNPTLLALTRYDRESFDAGIYRSTDYGDSWTRVYTFKRTITAEDPQPPPPPAGQVHRAPTSGHLVYAACGNTFAISSNTGWTFTDAVIPPAMPWDEFLHVTASVPETPGGVPQALYVLGYGVVFVSFDGGTTWTRDASPTLPASAGTAVGTAVSAAPNTLVVSPLSVFEVFTVLTSGELWHGDYTNFSTTGQSVWSKVDSLPAPVPGGKPFQDSGCVNLAVPQPGGGNVIFVSPMQSNAYVGSVNAQGSYNWQQLDVDYQVHVDLHGLFLSADFKADFQNGQYEPQAGSVWLLSDGGIYKSGNGGLHFQYSAHGVSTLAAVGVAGVHIPEKGVALSFNTGDNDGFYSLDGGGVWSQQDYGGGDNDCAFADPLRPSSMLVFTPRWLTKLAFYETGPGSLPDARAGTHEVFYIDGPPKPSTFNAVSSFGERGSRPLVLSLFGDSPHLPGDYVFVVFTTDTSGTPRAFVARTQNIPDISGNDWITPGGNVVQEGPDLPDPNLGVLQASGGHTNTVFYAGGNDANELWTWSNGMNAWRRIVPGGGSTIAPRFFVNPYNPNVIYILDEQDVKRSDDGGASWRQDASLQQQLTCGGRIPVSRAPQSDLYDNVEVVLTDMQFDPYLGNVRFAIGEGGVFYTDDAVNWHRLLDAGAIPGRPMNIYYDWVSETGHGTLYVSFAGRGLLRIGPVPTQQPGLVWVPEVQSLPTTLAVDRLVASHLVPHLTGAITPGSWVMTQSPNAGEIVTPGSTVTLFSHQGPLP